MDEMKGMYKGMGNSMENNKVSVSGRISNALEYSHEMYGEKFYAVDVAVDRQSGVLDYVPLMVPGRLIDAGRNYIGQPVRVSGQFRSYNRHEEKKNRLVLSVFVRELEFVEKLPGEMETNKIFLDGYICKEPAYRTTPLGREITDIMLGVNRPDGRSDYIPCICWGRNARYASSLAVGTRMSIWGRVQSREYVKKISDMEEERRVAYEVSVSRLETAERKDGK